MSNSNFKIGMGLEFPTSGVLSTNAMLGGALQFNANNVATELFVNNALNNINVAQFIESVAPGSPLQVNSGQLSLGLEIGAGRLAVVDVAGANALTVNPDLYAMNSINMIGNIFTISNTGVMTYSNGNLIDPVNGITFNGFTVTPSGYVATPQIQSANIQATGYIDLGPGFGISTNPDDVNNSFYISNTGDIQRAGIVTAGSLSVISPGNTETTTILSQVADEATVGGVLNVWDLRVGYDSFGATIGNGNVTVAGTTTLNGGLTVAGVTTLSGDLIVNGTTTTLNTETLLVEDNLITLNSNITAGNTAAPVQSGIEVLRGDSPTAKLYWDEMAPSQGWYISDGNTSTQLGASFISSVSGVFTVGTYVPGQLGLNIHNTLATDTMNNLAVNPLANQLSVTNHYLELGNVYAETATDAVLLAANTVAAIGTLAPGSAGTYYGLGNASQLKSFEAHVTLTTPSGESRTSKLIGVNNNGSIDYNEYAIIENATSGYLADVTVVDGTANGGQITIQAAHGIDGTTAIVRWTAVSF